MSWSGNADPYLVPLYTGDFIFHIPADNDAFILFSAQNKHIFVLSIFASQKAEVMI
jgi:hypothetical protein